MTTKLTPQELEDLGVRIDSSLMKAISDVYREHKAKHPGQEGGVIAGIMAGLFAFVLNFIEHSLRARNADDGYLARAKLILHKTFMSLMQNTDWNHTGGSDDEKPIDDLFNKLYSKD